MFLLLAAVVIAAIPCEYVIDCSDWKGQKRSEVTFRYETWDAQTFTGTVELNTDSNAEGAVQVFTLDVSENGWRVEKVGKTGFVLRGSKTSPIKSATFKGDNWVPVVHRRFATAAKAPDK